MKTIELPDEAAEALTAKATAAGLTLVSWLKQVAETEQKPLPVQPRATSDVRKPLAARIREIWADMPNEVRAKLPADGASQHDHYIYGVPKRTL